MDQLNGSLAGDLVEQADRAYRDASRPPMSAARAAFYAVLAGAGVAALAQFPGHRLEHLFAMVLGLALVAAAHILPLRARARAGLRGYAGPTSRQNLVHLLVVISLTITAIDATPTLAILYLVGGAVVGAMYFLVLRAHRWTTR